MKTGQTPLALTEPELIRQSRAGDADAFARLIQRYEDRIYNLAHKVCSTAPAEADDIYQETFLTAFKKIHTFRQDAQLGTWLYRIAANLCFMRLRRKRSEPFVPIVPSPEDEHASVSSSRGFSLSAFKDPSDGPAASARKKELQAAVLKALDALPVDHRLVVVLKDIQDLSNAEIARVMKLSVPAVKSKLHRGRLALRARMSAAVKDG